MKVIPFKDQTHVLAKNQPEYKDLPILKIEGKGGVVVSCWKPTIWERLKLLFTGRIWVSSMTFNTPLQPILLAIDKEDIYTIQE